MPGPDKSKIHKDFSLDKKAKINFRQHVHALPLCSNGQHHTSCAGSGSEASCVKIITGYDKATGRLRYGAFCSHFYW